MDISIPPMSWPLPPTSPTQSFAHLQLQLKSLRNDISRLTAKSEAAADRAAQILHRVRNPNEAGLATSYEPGSPQTELSITLRDHPFARFSYHDIAQSQEWATTLDVSQSQKNATQQSKPLELNEMGPSGKIIAQGALHSTSCSVPEAAKHPLHSTYEQSRAFLEVTASVKDEKNRAAQCDVVERKIEILISQITETTSIDVCMLVAHQIIAYLRFLNLERIRRFIHEHTRHIPQHCTSWWGEPSNLVEEALARCSLIREVNDPIFDGVVALVLIHFGVVDLYGSRSRSRDRSSKNGGRRLSKLLKRARKPNKDSQYDATHSKTRKIASRTPALSVDALIAITELCLQGVFSGSVLCDIISLFSLGDLDNDFAEVEDDWELLTTFLQQGLQPRAAPIKAKFSNADPVRDLLAVLDSMRKLKEVKNAKPLSSVDRLTPRLSSSSRAEDTEWVPLERFPSSAVLSWSRYPRTPLTKWLPVTKGAGEDSTAITAHRPVNMIDILNGHTLTRDSAA